MNAALRSVLAVPLLLVAAGLRGAPVVSATPLPHLERRGVATQLVVDGSPYLVLGGELHNTATSSPEYLRPVWPQLAALGLNTALAAVAWDWIEPKEGRFDFTWVDATLASAREQRLRLILVWFGSWKNGLSSFAPAWVKRDLDRFPRVRLASGRAVEILSTFSTAAQQADARAFAALMRHVREVDPQHTVIMVQLENEVGVLGDSRDRSPAANAAFAGAVPPSLLARLQSPACGAELHEQWRSAGARTAGTWSDVFGMTPAADEIFQAWHYAQYLDAVAEAGKAELALPLFTNTWIVQPEDRGPGDYPSGGPEPLTLDVWRVGAPHVDLNCPDIYLPAFAEWCRRFHRPDNPLFVPESRGDGAGVANAFYAIGTHAALGYSPFGIDDLTRLSGGKPVGGEADAAALPLARGYRVLRALAPLILDAQAKGTIGAVVLSPDRPARELAIGRYTAAVELRRNRRDPAQLPPLGYALVIGTGPDEYLVAGADVQVTFAPNPVNGDVAGLAGAEAGTVVDGRWQPSRQMNGDDVLLRYDLAAAADAGQSGSGLRFTGPEPRIQRVTLYRYR